MCAICFACLCVAVLPVHGYEVKPGTSGSLHAKFAVRTARRTARSARNSSVDASAQGTAFLTSEEMSESTRAGSVTQPKQETPYCPQMGYGVSIAATAAIHLAFIGRIVSGRRVEAIIGARRYIQFMGLTQAIVLTMAIPNSLKLTRLVMAEGVQEHKLAAMSGLVISAQNTGLGKE